MRRKIIYIHEDKCNGCGLCAQACHEGAIEMVDGKAKLVSDEYCDGLGDCLPECPTGAIEMIEKETVAYDEEAVERRKAERQKREAERQKRDAAGDVKGYPAVKEHRDEDKKPMACGCPGSMARLMDRGESVPLPHAPCTDHDNRERAANPAGPAGAEKQGCGCGDAVSELRQWPVQLNLVGTGAAYLENADLLIAADCTAYAYANFHRDFIKGRITLIGCPKLDDNNYYTEKLTEMFSRNSIRSIMVVRMQVPCCGGIVSAVKKAMLDSQTIVPYSEVVITPDGRLL